MPLDAFYTTCSILFDIAYGFYQQSWILKSSLVITDVYRLRVDSYKCGTYYLFFSRLVYSFYIEAQHDVYMKGLVTKRDKRQRKKIDLPPRKGRR